MPRTPRQRSRAVAGQQPQQHFGVAAGGEALAARFERPPQLAVVVDLAVEHDAMTAVGRGHRLRAGGPGIDDREAACGPAGRRRAGERHAPPPSGPRCASAAPSAAAGSGAIAPPWRTTPAMPHIRRSATRILISSFGCTLSSSSTDISTVLPFDDADDPDAPIGAALGEAAGEDDRLTDGRARCRARTSRDS